jgi:hypothetical protein
LDRSHSGCQQNFDTPGRVTPARQRRAVPAFDTLAASTQ